MEDSRLKKAFIVISIAVLLVVSTGSAAIGSETRKDLLESGGIDPAAMIVDFSAARPVGLASLVTGSVFFVASLPFSLLGGNTGMAYEKMIVDPARYTFLRPLGGF